MKAKNTRILIIYSNIFLLIKLTYSLLNAKWISENEDFLSAMGFSEEFTKGQRWTVFEYDIQLQSWIVLIGGYLHSFMLEMFADKTEIDFCLDSALDILKARFPKTTKIFNKVWSLKRNILLILIFLTFTIFIMALPRCFVYWVF